MDIKQLEKMLEGKKEKVFVGEPLEMNSHDFDTMNLQL